MPLPSTPTLASPSPKSQSASPSSSHPPSCEPDRTNIFQPHISLRGNCRREAWQLSVLVGKFDYETLHLCPAALLLLEISPPPKVLPRPTREVKGCNGAKSKGQRSKGPTNLNPDHPSTTTNCDSDSNSDSDRALFFLSCPCQCSSRLVSSCQSCTPLPRLGPRVIVVDRLGATISNNKGDR